MKKVLLTAMVLAAILSVKHSKAQFRSGSKTHQNQYYYYPEVDMYYDINNRRFVYEEGNRWVYATKLPYQNYDLNRGFRVSINEYKPYLHADEYRDQYRSYYDNYNHRSLGNNRQNRNSPVEVNRQVERNEMGNSGDQGQTGNTQQRSFPKDNNGRPEIIKEMPPKTTIDNLERNDGTNVTPNTNTAQPSSNNKPQAEIIKEAQPKITIDNTERSENGNATNKAPNDNTVQPSSAGSKAGTEIIKPELSKETIPKTVINKEATPAPKAVMPQPQAAREPIQKTEVKDDAARAREFYGMGQAGGGATRDAIRNPKYDTTNSQNKIAKDTVHKK
ncbi:MAG: hypothetical protein ABI581_04885 [Sediminibacterium sp.]